jgi:hypothetical protein
MSGPWGRVFLTSGRVAMDPPRHTGSDRGLCRGIPSSAARSGVHGPMASQAIRHPLCGRLPWGACPADNSRSGARAPGGGGPSLHPVSHHRVRFGTRAALLTGRKHDTVV